MENYRILKKYNPGIGTWVFFLQRGRLKRKWFSSVKYVWDYIYTNPFEIVKTPDTKIAIEWSILYKCPVVEEDPITKVLNIKSISIDKESIINRIAEALAGQIFGVVTTTATEWRQRIDRCLPSARFLVERFKITEDA